MDPLPQTITLPQRPWLRPVLAAGLAAALVAATWTAYWPALKGDFLWDDDSHIKSVSGYADWKGLWRIWSDHKTTPQYYPLTHTTFWIENQLWGPKDPQNPDWGVKHAIGFHAVNISLQCLNALLLWWVLRRLGLKGAWLAAAIFALHPVHVESVAWMTERKNVLSMFFALLSVLMYLRAWGLAQPAGAGAADAASDQPGWRNWTAYGLSVVFFAAALLSKTAIVPLPGALLLLSWWKRGRLRWTDWLTIPFFLLSLGFGWLTFHLEKNQVGATGLVWQTDLAQRIILAGRAFWFYAWKLVWPDDLTFVYGRWWVSASDVRLYAFPGAVLGAIAALWVLRRRITRGPLTAFLFYAGMLLPALGLANIYYFRYANVADHFQYYASLGPIALAAWCVGWLWHRAAVLWRLLFVPACVGLLAILGQFTWQQCHAYRDVESLWLDTLDKNPRAALALNNLGAHRELTGRLDLAMVLFERAIEADPFYPDPYSNLGRVYSEHGNPARGLTLLNKAIDLDDSIADEYYNRGNAYLASRDFEAAIRDYTKTIELNPGHARAYSNRGAAKLNMGDMDTAMTDIRQASKIAPQYADPHLNRATIHIMRREFPEALEAVNDAIRADRNRPDGYLKRALVRAQLHDYDGAEQDARDCAARGGELSEAFLKEIRRPARP